MEELDLKEVFNMFWSRKVYMIIIILIFIILGAIYSYFYVTPKYKAYTTLVLATSTEDTETITESITSTDISLNNNLVATYSELIKSKTVLRQVINNLGINKTEDTLKNNVSVSAVKSTQLIQINVTDENPYQAKIIANEVAKVFINEVTAKYYGMNNVHVVDEAEEESTPYNINHTKDIMMFTFVGLVLACMYVLIANILDTTVKNKEDVERRLGLTVLVNIPICNFDELPKITKKGGRK